MQSTCCKSCKSQETPKLANTRRGQEIQKPLFEELYDTETAARILGVSPASLRKWRSEGELPGHVPPIPYVKLGKTVRYRKSDLQAYIEHHLCAPKAYEVVR